MKVIVYCSSMSAAGGTERVVAKHIEFLADDNHVTLMTKDNCNSFYSLPTEIQKKSLHIDFFLNMNSRLSRVLKIISTFISTIKSLRKALREIRPEVVYVASPLNLLEVYLTGFQSRRIAVTEHASFGAYNKIYKMIIACLYPRVGLLIVPTKLDSSGYTRKGIKNFYLPNPLSFNNREVSDQRQKVALSVGRLTADKRHDLLIEIWHLSGVHLKGWKLRIIGKGECEFDLRRKIDALGLSASVTLEKPTTKIEDEYMNSSIFLLTSRAEGFGLVLIEAMAFGVPCVSFDCPSGPRDIIDDNLTGRLIDEGDIDGYVEALQQLASNHFRRLEFGRNARMSVNRFQAEKVRSEFIKLFNQAFKSALI